MRLGSRANLSLEPLYLRQHPLQEAFQRGHLLSEPLVAGLGQKVSPSIPQVLAHGARHGLQVRDLLRDGAFVVVNRELRVRVVWLERR